MPDTAVFHSISQTFLQDPEQANRDLRRYRIGNIGSGKINLDLVLVRQFCAEALAGSNKPEIFQLGGVEAVRDRLDL